MLNSRISLEKIPPQFCCPITLQIMTDPVIAPDGYSYERRAIVAHLSKKNESPITRESMNINQLIPNRALKDTIEDFLKLSPTQNEDYLTLDSKDLSNEFEPSAPVLEEDESLFDVTNKFPPSAPPLEDDEKHHYDKGYAKSIYNDRKLLKERYERAILEHHLNRLKRRNNFRTTLRLIEGYIFLEEIEKCLEIIDDDSCKIALIKTLKKRYEYIKNTYLSIVSISVSVDDPIMNFCLDIAKYFRLDETLQYKLLTDPSTIAFNQMQIDKYPITINLLKTLFPHLGIKNTLFEIANRDYIIPQDLCVVFTYFLLNKDVSETLLTQPFKYQPTVYHWAASVNNPEVLEYLFLISLQKINIETLSEIVFLPQKDEHTPLIKEIILMKNFLYRKKVIDILLSSKINIFSIMEGLIKYYPTKNCDENWDEIIRLAPDAANLLKTLNGEMFLKYEDILMNILHRCFEEKRYGIAEILFKCSMPAKLENLDVILNDFYNAIKTNDLIEIILKRIKFKIEIKKDKENVDEYKKYIYKFFDKLAFFPEKFVILISSHTSFLSKNQLREIYKKLFTHIIREKNNEELENYISTLKEETSSLLTLEDYRYVYESIFSIENKTIAKEKFEILVKTKSRLTSWNEKHGILENIIRIPDRCSFEFFIALLLTHFNSTVEKRKIIGYLVERHIENIFSFHQNEPNLVRLYYLIEGYKEYFSLEVIEKFNKLFKQLKNDLQFGIINSYIKIGIPLNIELVNDYLFNQLLHANEFYKVFIKNVFSYLCSQNNFNCNSFLDGMIKNKSWRLLEDDDLFSCLTPKKNIIYEFLTAEINRITQILDQNQLEVSVKKSILKKRFWLIYAKTFFDDMTQDEINKYMTARTEINNVLDNLNSEFSKEIKNLKNKCTITSNSFRNILLMQKYAYKKDKNGGYIHNVRIFPLALPFNYSYTSANKLALFMSIMRNQNFTSPKYLDQFIENLRSLNNLTDEQTLIEMVQNTRRIGYGKLL